MDILKPKDILTLRASRVNKIVVETAPMPHGEVHMRQRIKIFRPGFRPVLAIFEYMVEPCVCGGARIPRERSMAGGHTHRCADCGKTSIPMCSEV